jgi:hypothetical protein
MLDDKMLNAVLVLMLVAILGPILTERFTPRMLVEGAPAKVSSGEKAD